MRFTQLLVLAILIVAILDLTLWIALEVARTDEPKHETHDYFLIAHSDLEPVTFTIAEETDRHDPYRQYQIDKNSSDNYEEIRNIIAKGSGERVKVINQKGMYD
jgi:hypothetical protein